MERRDYVEKQIDSVGLALAKLLVGLLGKNGAVQIEDNNEITNQALKTELGFDLEALLLIEDNEFVEKLKNEKKLSNDSLDKLALVLMTLADKGSINIDSKRQKSLYGKSLVVYEYLEENEPVLQFDRHVRIDRIKILLKNQE